MIISLLHKNPKYRLGHDGAEDIKKHQFYSDVDFDKLYSKDYEALNLPKLNSDLGLNNFDKEFTCRSISSFDLQKK